MSQLTPHGPGFSFLDSCEVSLEAKSARGTKFLDPSLSFFKDHFPGKPLMPGVFLVEAAAQASGFLWAAINPECKGALFLVQISQFRFLKSVLPGELLNINATLEKDFGTLAIFEVELSVGAGLVASGRVTMGQMPPG